MSLLEHPGAARQVGDPGLRLFGPGVVAIKPETVRSERETGRQIGHGLVRGLVNLEAVDA